MIKMVSLRDVCDVIMGSAPLGESYVEIGAGIPLVAGAGDLGERNPSPTKATTQPTQLSSEGDIILCIRATIGDLNWSDKQYCLGRGVAALRPHKVQLAPKYLWHWMGRNSDQLVRSGRGSTFKQVGRRDIEDMSLALPPIEEQRRIAAILDKADAICRKRQQTVLLSASLIRSSFLDVFGDPISNPKGWPKCSIMDVAHVTDGTHDTPKYVESGYPLLTSRNLKKDGLDFESVQYISEDDHNKISVRSAVNRGDILFAMIGTIGNATIVETDRLFSVKNVALFKPNSKVCSTYIWSVLRDNHYLSSVLGLRLGGNQPFVGLGTLRSLVIPVPPIALQKKYDQMISRISALVQKQKKSLQESENMFNSLQSELF